MKFHLMPYAACVAVVATAFPASTVSAQGSEIEQLRTTVETLQKNLDSISSELAATQARLRELETKAAPTTEASPHPDNPPEMRGVIHDNQSFADNQSAAARPYNFPLAPGLEGFLPLFNTKTVLKLGGYIRVDAITDAGNNGNPNQFVPSSFPTGPTVDDENRLRSQIHAKASRLTFELRRPVAENQWLRIYYENDFFNNSGSPSMDYRLRHLYGQAFNLMAGLGFSTFQDVDASPDTLDAEGPNSQVSKRQPQIRYTIPFGDKSTSLAFALEQPSTEVGTGGLPAGATPVSRLPDLTAAWRSETKTAHMQLAAVLRDLGYEQTGGSSENVLGWGLSASGAFTVFGDDRIFAQVACGEGVARYFNDTGGLGLDASIDASGSFSALPLIAGMIGYAHAWNNQWRSNLSYGYLAVDAEEPLGPFAFDNTGYASANIIWQPARSLRIGVEALWGVKEIQNGDTTDGFRTNFVIKYDLIK
jgi:hypothetical protein